MSQKRDTRFDALYHFIPDVDVCDLIAEFAGSKLQRFTERYMHQRRLLSINLTRWVSFRNWAYILNNLCHTWAIDYFFLYYNELEDVADKLEIFVDEDSHWALGPVADADRNMVTRTKFFREITEQLRMSWGLLSLHTAPANPQTGYFFSHVGPSSKLFRCITRKGYVSSVSCDSIKPWAYSMFHNFKPSSTLRTNKSYICPCRPYDEEAWVYYASQVVITSIFGPRAHIADNALVTLTNPDTGHIFDSFSILQYEVVSTWADIVGMD